MQVISEVGPCVGRDVSFSRNFEKVHVLEGSDYPVGAELLSGTVDLLRKVLVYDERKEAGEEVCGDAVVASLTKFQATPVYVRLDKVSL